MPVEARNYRRYDRDFGQNGVIAPMGSALVMASASVTASRAYYLRFVPSRTFSATIIAFAVGTGAGADDEYSVALYDALGARLVTSGTVAASGKLNGTGIKTQAITATTLQAGVVYHAGISTGVQGGTAAALAVASSVGSATTTDFFGTAIGTRIMSFEAAAHPCPLTMTPAGAVGSAPFLAVRES